MRKLVKPLDLARPLAIITDYVKLEGRYSNWYVLVHKDAAQLTVDENDPRIYDLGFHCQDQPYYHVPEKCYQVPVSEIEKAIELSLKKIRTGIHGLASVQGNRLVGYLSGIRDRL